MTEADWLACTDPSLMLLFLRGKASDRKLRLFAVACCRSFWPVLMDSRSRDLLNATEQFADGLATREELEEVRRRHIHIYYGGGIAVETTAYDNARQAAETILYRLKDVRRRAARWRSRGRPEALLRDNFSPLTFRGGTMDAALLRWNDDVVVRLAQAAYEERHMPAGTLDNTRLLILADALEEAGCTDTDILGHLRGPGPHVRGCWAVDICLGKE